MYIRDISTFNLKQIRQLNSLGHSVTVWPQAAATRTSLGPRHCSLPVILQVFLPQGNVLYIHTHDAHMCYVMCSLVPFSQTVYSFLFFCSFLHQSRTLIRLQVSCWCYSYSQQCPMWEWKSVQIKQWVVSVHSAEHRHSGISAGMRFKVKNSGCNEVGQTCLHSALFKYALPETNLL